MLASANMVERVALRVCACEHSGMGNPLVPSDFDSLIASRLDVELRESPLSLRELSRESEVKLTRLGDVLRRGKAMTVGELRAICESLGLVASEVVREAEEAVAGAEEPAVVDPAPAAPAGGWARGAAAAWRAGGRAGARVGADGGKGAPGACAGDRGADRVA